MPNPLQHGEQFILLEKHKTSDGMGGYITEYVRTLEFIALMTLDSSVEAKIAAQSGVVDLYTVFVEKEFPIEAGDYFIRKSDDAIFRVASSPDENKAPDISTMNVKSFSASKTQLPTG